MNETYWNTFALTGRVADYLNYRNAWDTQTDGTEKMDRNSTSSTNSKQTGAKKRESDRSDGNGAVRGTHRRI